ncbi:persephin-like [Paramormyrops kingsleyae]|uniref:persephin-like n=1 Tax=Paramormyrops kingsleyae TaxID=1676925 RepID=UPI003B96A42B
MKILLNVAVLLCCVHRDDGHLLHSLLGLQGKAFPPDSPESGALLEDSDGEEQETGRQGAARARRDAESPCGLRMLLLRVRELGLGYDSDETVLFKYCSGTCPFVRSNHDLTLTNLLLRGALPPPLPGDSWHSTPCCRPTHHEDLAFLDNTHRWHKVEELSAAACTCVG